MSEAPLRVEGLSKSYRKGVRAVDGLDLRVGPGEVVAFVGRNGAGKTTTLHCLLGLLAPESGSIRVLGRPPGDREARRDLGFQAEIFYAYPYLSAARTLHFFGRLAGMDEPARTRAIPALLDRFGLGEVAGQRVGSFSKGMTQRLGLAQAVLHEPRLLVLDEPTTGLDPTGRRLVAEIIEEQRQKGTSVLFSSHILSDVERLCDRVVMIEKGKPVLDATMDSLQTTEDRWLLEVVGWRPDMIEAMRRVGGELATEAPSDVPSAAVWISCSGADRSRVFLAIGEVGAQLGEVRRARRSLEALYLSLVEAKP